MGFLHGIRNWVIPSFLWKFARKAFLLLYENVTINGPLHVQSHILLHLRRWRMNEGNAWKRPFVEIFRSRTLSTFNVHVTWNRNTFQEFQNFLSFHTYSGQKYQQH